MFQGCFRAMNWKVEVLRPSIQFEQYVLYILKQCLSAFSNYVKFVKVVQMISDNGIYHFIYRENRTSFMLSSLF